MLSSRKRGGSTPSRLGGVPQRGVVAVQSANVGSRFLAMCDFSQCMMVVIAMVGL